MTVVWSATDGTIDSGGIFKPPQVTAPKRVFITAVASGTNRAVTKTITVIKHKFDVVTEQNAALKLRPGQQQTLTIDPLPASAEEQAQIAWDVIPKDIQLSGRTGPQITLTVPESTADETIVTVRATYAGLSRTVPFQVMGTPAP